MRNDTICSKVRNLVSKKGCIRLCSWACTWGSRSLEIPRASSSLLLTSHHTLFRPPHLKHHHYHHHQHHFHHHQHHHCIVSIFITITIVNSWKVCCGHMYTSGWFWVGGVWVLICLIEFRLKELVLPFWSKNSWLGRSEERLFSFWEGMELGK